MATGGPRGLQFRSGGKMVRPRRAAVPKTPYDRPRAPRVWISKLISVGGKLLSSVVGAESSSSSSASSSDASSSSNDIDDKKNNDNEVPSWGIDTMGTREPQSIIGKSETKRLIEQLLMEETFSREECDRLTSIIKSRVVGSPMIGHVETGKLNHDLCSTAVMEARKWFKEKSGSNAKPELFHGTCLLNTFMLPNSVDGDVGSPVELAKSYMQTRPPWSSPSVNPIEYRSSSPRGIQLFKEGTPYSIGNTSQSSFKLKTDCLTSDSRNIMEDLRKVRSKATEEMLRTLPSSKADWTTLTLEHKNSTNSVVADKLETAKEDKMHSSSKLLDVLLDMAARPVSQMKEDASQKDTLKDPTPLISEENQGMETTEGSQGNGDERLGLGLVSKSAENHKTVLHSDAGATDVDCLEDLNGTTDQLNSGRVQDPKSLDKNCLAFEEVTEVAADARAANGCPSLGSRLTPVPDKEQIHKSVDGGESMVASEHDRRTSAAGDETCEPLFESSIEVDIVSENEGIASDFHNSYSMHHEGSSQELDRPTRKDNLTGKNHGGEKQRGKVSGYRRRRRIR